MLHRQANCSYAGSRRVRRFRSLRRSVLLLVPFVYCDKSGLRASGVQCEHVQRRQAVCLPLGLSGDLRTALPRAACSFSNGVVRRLYIVSLLDSFCGADRAACSGHKAESERVFECRFRVTPTDGTSRFRLQACAAPRKRPQKSRTADLPPLGTICSELSIAVCRLSTGKCAASASSGASRAWQEISDG